MSANPVTGTKVGALEPAPHFVVPNFLGQAAVAQLLRYCVSNEAAFGTTSVGDGQSTKIDGRLRRSRSLTRPDQFAVAVQRTMQERITAMLPAIVAALKMGPFQPAKFEMELVAHGDGAFFAKHIDTFTGIADLPPAHRMISAVYYFFAEPKGFSGGELRLYPLLDANDEGNYLDIQPVNDTLICFPSFAPHAVRPIICPTGQFGDSRFAINNWICRDNSAITRGQ